MQKYLSILFFFVISNFYSFSQSKWEYGVKVAANHMATKLYEFFDPFPYYDKDLNNPDFPSPTIYGTNPSSIGFNLGGFLNYKLLKNNRIKLTFGFDINNKTYKQRDNNSNEFKINKVYLDIPLSIKLQPFYKAGVFLEPGIYQAFNLSGKTNFPDLNANSNEFEKRRSRGNTRETNLFGFNIGAGYEFKKFDVSAAFQSDKQYDYMQLGLRVKLPKLLGNK